MSMVLMDMLEDNNSAIDFLYYKHLKYFFMITVSSEPNYPMSEAKECFLSNRKFHFINKKVSVQGRDTLRDLKFLDVNM